MLQRCNSNAGRDPKTFAGLSGIGEELGRGKKLDEILKAMGMVVAEGVKTSQSAYCLARQAGAETPIIDQIYAVLYENKEVKTAIRELMTRKARTEME
jgi:glycerol-3-phosphate dehydrogenase (NAD(P)+)